MRGSSNNIDPRLTWPLRTVLWLQSHSLGLWQRVLHRRQASGKESAQSLREKLMRDAPVSGTMADAQQPLIWGHAVGVGEVLALLGLFKRLAVYFPDAHFLLTSSSRTSGEAVAKQGLPERFHHRFAPIDHPEVLKRFFEAYKPALACWSETDLWPGMVTQAAQRGIPMVMFNARIDSDKAIRLRRWAWFFQPLLGRFTRIYAQSLASAQHLIALGYGARVAPCHGDIKALAPGLPADEQLLGHWHTRLGSRPVWVLASSHAGEEELALVAQESLLSQWGEALLVVVPRDAFRGTAIAQMARSQGLQVALRSAGEDAKTETQVYVADTMGELGLWYRLASVALIGGSLQPIGGHNPYEALALGCEVLSGPHVHNFAQSYAQLQAAGQARTVCDSVQVAQAVSSVWSRLMQAASNARPKDPYQGLPTPELLADIVHSLQALGIVSDQGKTAA